MKLTQPQIDELKDRILNPLTVLNLTYRDDEMIKEQINVIVKYLNNIEVE